MRSPTVATMSLVLVLALSSITECEQRAVGQPEFVGDIEELSDPIREGELVRILVATGGDRERCEHLIEFVITRDTELTEQHDGSEAAIAWGDLRRGDRVNTWTTGDVADSCPPQMQATAVVREAGD